MSPTNIVKSGPKVSATPSGDDSGFGDIHLETCVLFENVEVRFDATKHRNNVRGSDCRVISEKLNV